MDDRELIKTAVAQNIDRHPMIDASQSHIREIRIGWITEAVHAALAKAGRLASEVKGDVLLKAYDEAVEVYAGISGEIESDALHAAVVAASGVVAADAERRVRAAVLEEAAKACDGLYDQAAGDHERGGILWCAETIRALLTPSPAAQPEGER